MMINNNYNNDNNNYKISCLTILLSSLIRLCKYFVGTEYKIIILT